MRLTLVLQRARVRAAAAAIVAVAACSDDPMTTGPSPRDGEAGATAVRCDADNGGITLPPGFCAVVVADSIGVARHLVVDDRGTLFVAVDNASDGTVGGIVALRDTNGDGKADQRTKFGSTGGHGIALWRDWLYFAPNDRVERYMVDPQSLLPTSGPELVVGAFPDTGDHVTKTILINHLGTLFVNVGSASNSCQVENRVLHSPGIDPCPELRTRAGVWRYDANRLGQTHDPDHRYATGLRNMVALAFEPRGRRLFGVQHGRDDLNVNWPELFTVEEQAVLPSEELVRIDRGDDNGWPYCYHDPFLNRKVLAPEYGGNGEIVGRCARYEVPLLTFPAHWAPNGLHFYGGRMFPARYRGGAFIAFHGGHDRAPLPNEGYNVVFVPGPDEGRWGGDWEIFANNFAQSSGPLPATARHRPVGVTEGPDGSLYISDDQGGRIWRVVYTGS
jgi:glucose/arabinose dehydrogenase